MHTIVVNAMAEEMRLAVVDDNGILVDYSMERPENTPRVNHMYKGVVKNILPGMQAAFIDIGGTQNAYINLQQGKEKGIVSKWTVGQSVLVQVVKEEMLGKGARVTADVSLAGRYVVLLPFGKQMHMSKQITDTVVRERLQDIGAPFLAKGVGFIIRTAAVEATEAAIEQDMAYLYQTWEHVQKRYKVAKPGTQLYADADFWFRLVRDYGRPNVRRIIVDSLEGAKRITDLLERSESFIEVVLHDGKEPVFKQYGIESQLDALSNANVDLPSGGSIRIDHTEALTVMDVNSAHYTGRSSGAEEVAWTVNREAAVEICRQLRLRDIGGIIVCDFIDMRSKQHQEDLLKLLAKLAKEDTVKTVVCGISSLGLVEMTRKRARQGLETVMFDTCPHCGGTGYVLSPQSIYIQIVRRIQELYRAGRLRTGVLVEAHPQVCALFTKKVLADLSTRFGKTIQVDVNEQMSLEGYAIMAVND